MSNDKQIGLKVSAEKLLEIGKVSERKGQSMAGWVRTIVYEKLEQEQEKEAA